MPNLGQIGPRFRSGLFLVFLVLAFAATAAIRYASVPLESADLVHFRTWYRFIADNGHFAALTHEWFDYNVPYLYLLAAVGAALPSLDPTIALAFAVYKCVGVKGTTGILRGEPSSPSHIRAGGCGRLRRSRGAVAVRCLPQRQDAGLGQATLLDGRHSGALFFECDPWRRGRDKLGQIPLFALRRDGWQHLHRHGPIGSTPDRDLRWAAAIGEPFLRLVRGFHAIHAMKLAELRNLLNAWI